MANLQETWIWVYQEFGLASLVRSPLDVYLIILCRTCRMFAHGSNALFMALFFSSLKFTDFQIGAFMTLTMGGDVILGILLTLVADKLGRRKVLLAGSIMMAFSGFVFAVFQNFWVLLLAAVVGVISVAGGDFGPFRAIEESIMSQLTTSRTRSDVLSWYVTFSSVGSMLGTELAGRAVQGMIKGWDWTPVRAYHTVFWVYGGMGVVNLACVAMLSKRCEAEPVNEVKSSAESSEEAGGLLRDGEANNEDGEVHNDNDSETTLRSESQQSASNKPKGMFAIGSFLAVISPATRRIMYPLCLLLSLDSLADGMVPYSLTTYYIDNKFSVSKSFLGDVMALAFFLATLSTIFAAPLARRLGLINTMVFTHVPSSLAVLLFPFAPHVSIAVIFLLIRTGLNNMDQAPRAAFIAAVVQPSERTAVLGITSLLRTLSAMAGPSLTGLLAGNDRFGLAFVAAGACRLAYDFVLWAMFVNMTIKEDQDEDEEISKNVDGQSDEEELREVTK